VADVSYRIQVSQSGLNSIITGPVARNIEARGRRVLLAARANAPYRTGRLRSSLQMQVVNRNPPQVSIYSNLPYAVYQEKGTGIYAGRGYIYPTRAPFLVFTPKGSSRVVFARRVRGTPPTHFLERALEVAAR